MSNCHYANDTLTLASKYTKQLEINSYNAFNKAKKYCDSSHITLNERKTTQVYSSKRNQPAELPNLNAEEI